MVQFTKKRRLKRECFYTIEHNKHTLKTSIILNMLIVKMQAWNRETTQYKAALQLDATAIGKGPIRMYIRTLPHWNYARLDSTGKSIKIVLLICCHSPTQPNSSLEWQICRHFHATAGSFYAKHVMHSKTNFEVDFLNANFFLPTKNDKFRMAWSN